MSTPTSLPEWTQPAPLLVIARFAVPEAEAAAFSAELREMADLLAGLHGCTLVDVGRATDDPTLWVLSSSWESVGDYRRALSSYDIKVRGVPVLSRAVDEPSAFEVLYGRRGEAVVSASSARAVDADTVGLGDVTAFNEPR